MSCRAEHYVTARRGWDKPSGKVNLGSECETFSERTPVSHAAITLLVPRSNCTLGHILARLPGCSSHNAHSQVQGPRSRYRSISVRRP